MPEILTKNRPAWIGLVVAPIVPFLLLTMSGIWATGGLGNDFFVGAYLMLPICYLASLMAGLPVIFILRRLGLQKIKHYAFAGLIASSVPIFVILIFPFLISDDPSSPSEGFIAVHYKIAAIMVACGMLVAVAFWAITRPDKATGAP